MTQEWLCKPSSATWLLQSPSETSVVWPADRPEYRDTASNWCTHPTADPSPIYCSFWSKFKSSRNNQSCSYLGREVFLKKISHCQGCEKHSMHTRAAATGILGRSWWWPPGVRWELKGAFLPGSKSLERERNNRGMTERCTASQMCLQR